MLSICSCKAGLVSISIAAGKIFTMQYQCLLPFWRPR